jgi:hypothetical protein
LLLLEYVIHILQSCIEEEEEEEEEKDIENLRDVMSDDQSLVQPDQALFHLLDSSPTLECTSPSMELPSVTLKDTSESPSSVGVSNVTIQVLGFYVDTATGNKVEIQDTLPQHHNCFKRNKSYKEVWKPIKITWHSKKNNKGFSSPPCLRSFCQRVLQ